MKAIEATLTSKGQVTVPAPMRRALGLKAGDKLVFTQDRQGRFVVEARTEALANLRGLVARADRATAAAIDSARVAGWIEESRAARWLRMRGEDGDT